MFLSLNALILAYSYVELQHFLLTYVYQWEGKGGVKERR